jgi:hypothetical protein
MQAQIKSKSAKSMLLALKQPFDTRFLKVRIGARTKDKSKGIALFYLDSREVQKRLDEVCGIDGWRSEMQETTEGVLCTISIRMPNGEWVSRTDGGEKSQVAPFKGACSDALKRAAAQFGIGRYLYYVPNSWHSLLNDGKIFADIESVRDSLPEWALPSKQIQDWEEIAIKEFKYGQDEVEELENPEKEADLIKTDDNKIKAIEEFLKKND